MSEPAENTTTPDAQNAATAAPEAPQVAQPPTPPQQAPQQAETDADKISRLERENTSLRSENAAKRVKAKTAEEEALATVAKALGFTPDGKKQVSLDDMTEQVTSLSNTNTTLQTENVVLRRAASAGADPDKLLNWAPFTRDVAELDQSGDGFTDKVDALIKDHVSKNSFLAARAAVKSGAEMPGGSGEGVTTKAQFDAMSNAEKNRLFQTNPELYQQLRD